MIQCSNPHMQYISHSEEIKLAINKVLESGNYILGQAVKDFEENFSNYCAVKYAVGVNSGTDALILSLKCLGIGHGDEVITVSHTAIATVAAIISVGAIPVLCDIDPNYYTIDINGIQNLVSKKTKAIIAVHIYGQAINMDLLMDIANRNNIKVIEDCAQATGALFNGRKLGTYGDLGCFSFYPTKNLGAIGDGGLVVTNNTKYAEHIKMMRQYGWDHQREPSSLGINSRLDELQACILRVKLKYLDDENKKRKEIAIKYNKGLEGFVEQLPIISSGQDSVHHLYVIQVNERDKMMKNLIENDIFPGIHYEHPIHLNRVYKKYCKIGNDGLKITERVSKKILSLPMYPELTEYEINKVVDAIISI